MDLIQVGRDYTYYGVREPNTVQSRLSLVPATPM